MGLSDGGPETGPPSAGTRIFGKGLVSVTDPDGPRRILVRANGPISYVSALLILLMMLTVVYDVIARLAFRAPTLWVIDVNEYLLVYVTFIPAAWILLRDEHVKVEILLSRLQPRTQRLMGFITDLMGLLYCVILTWQSWLVTWDAFQKGYRFSTALSLPQFPVFVIIPLGSAWLALAFLGKLWSAAGHGLRAAPSKPE